MTRYRTNVALAGCLLLVATSARAQEGEGGPARGGAQAAARAQQALQAAAAKPTPRTAEGKPLLTGNWTAPGAGGNAGPAAPANPKVSGDGKTLTLQLNTSPAAMEYASKTNLVRRWEADKDLRPVYKPEYEAKARRNFFERGDLDDPSYQCGNPGVPRIGTPSEIVHGPNAVYLLYAGQVQHFRIIPTDGRKHDATKDAFPMGDAVGTWEGDTLVVDVRNVAEETWIDEEGSFHSKDMRVVERFTRVGDTLRHEVRIEDPIFVQPLVRQPVTRVVAAAAQHLEPTYPCVEMSLPHMVGPERH